MPTYTVKAIKKIADGTSENTGAWTRQKIRLVNGDGAFTDVVAFFGKYQPPVPNPGDTLECEIGDPYKPGQLPQVVWPKKGRPGGGGRSYEADPRKQAAIAVESAQKVAVDTIRLAIETNQDPAVLAARVVEVSRVLVEQIQQAMEAAR